MNLQQKSHAHATDELLLCLPRHLSFHCNISRAFPLTQLSSLGMQSNQNSSSWSQHALTFQRTDNLCHNEIPSHRLSIVVHACLHMVQLQSVFDAIVFSRVLYAAPAGKGYLCAREMASLQQLFAKAKRWNIAVILMYYLIIVIEHFLDHLCILHTVCIICF